MWFCRCNVYFLSETLMWLHHVTASHAYLRWCCALSTLVWWRSVFLETLPPRCNKYVTLEPCSVQNICLFITHAYFWLITCPLCLDVRSYYCSDAIEAGLFNHICSCVLLWMHLLYHCHNWSKNVSLTHSFLLFSAQVTLMWSWSVLYTDFSPTQLAFTILDPTGESALAVYCSSMRCLIFFSRKVVPVFIHF